MSATELAPAEAANLADWHIEFLLRVPNVILRDGGWPQLMKRDGSGSLEDSWQVWRYGMAKKRVRPDEAAEALMALALDPPDWIGQIVPAFLKKVQEIRAARGETVAAMLVAAAKASEGCSLCHGSGLAIRYRQGTPDPRYWGGYTFYCLCGSGRAILSHHRDCYDNAPVPHGDLADPQFAKLSDERYSRQPERSLPAAMPAKSRHRLAGPSPSFTPVGVIARHADSTLV